jgi:glucokinase
MAFVGLDVGGTKIAVGSLRDGGFAPPTLVPTERSSQDALIGQLVQGIRAAIEQSRSRGAVAAVGVGIPSVVEFATGRVSSSVNVPLHDVPLRETLRSAMDGMEVYVDNDATCAALAEAHDDRGRLETPNLVMLTVGTGVGGGIVIDGLPYRGATGAAGELGHTIVGLDLSERAIASERFPRRGSLEALASGRALDELASATARAHPRSALGVLAGDGHTVTGPDALAAARAGDAHALAALTLLGERLGVGIANAINTLDPQVVAIGGGVSAAGDLLLAPAIESARRFVLPGVGARTEIRIARSGPQAGVRGAALLAALEHARAHGRRGGVPRPGAR